jgi:hypothetical protein
LTPFVQSSCLNPNKPQLEIKKIVAIMIYWFAHGFNATHMADWFNVGALTIWMYVDIVCLTKTNCLVHTSVLFQVNTSLLVLKIL